MALIDIKLIGEVAMEAYTGKVMFDAHLLGLERPGRDNEPGLILYAIKVEKQARNLLDRLRDLHLVCNHLAANQLDEYLAEHEKWRDDTTPDFDPFEKLERAFDSGCIFDLPPTIDIYADLLRFLPIFGRIRKAKREGFNKFFPNIQKGYLITDEAGNQRVVPISEMDPDAVAKIDANREIKEIEVEYCLDQYNEFYDTCQKLLAAHKPMGDYIGCAQSILELFVPYELKNP